MLNTDRECVQRCLNGHPEAFEDLVARYQAPLTGYICGRLRNREAAEEVAQEAFVRSFFALGKLRKPESYYAWLFGFAERVMKEYVRDKERTRRAVTISREQAHHEQEQAHHEQSAGDFDLEQAIAGLPISCREVVLMRYYGDLSCVDVAERMDVPLGTVTKRLSRAYEMLRRSLGTTDGSQEYREARP